MKKSILSVAALGLVLAACGGTGAVIASVNGQDITMADVEALSISSGALPEDQFSSDLLNTIVEYVVIQAAQEQYGITFGDDEIAQRRDELEQQVIASGQDYQEFLESRGFTDERVVRIGHQQLVGEAVEERLASDADPVPDEDLRALFDQQLYDRTNACVSHILVPTEEEAQAALDRIEGGEDFAAVAQEVGTDGTAPNGGDLGCQALSGYVVEFADAAFEAPIGEVVGPVESSFGFHLILVTDRTEPVYEDIVEELRVLADQQRRGTLVQQWLLDVVNAADVKIEPEFGSWVTEPFPQVIPAQ